jgi:hypothetical protein
MTTIQQIQSSIEGHVVHPVRPEWTQYPQISGNVYKVDSEDEFDAILSDELCMKIIKFNVDMGWLNSRQWWIDTLTKYASNLVKKNPSYINTLIYFMGRVNLVDEIVQLTKDELNKKGLNENLLVAYTTSISTQGKRYIKCHEILMTLMQSSSKNISTAAYNSIDWGFHWCLSMASEMYQEMVQLVPETVASIKKINETWHLKFCDKLIYRLKSEDLIKFYQNGLLIVPNSKTEKTMDCIAKDMKPLCADRESTLYDNHYKNTIKHKNKTCTCYCECTACWPKYCNVRQDSVKYE